jgi:hypothetical protein
MKSYYYPVTLFWETFAKTQQYVSLSCLHLLGSKHHTAINKTNTIIDS